METEPTSQKPPAPPRRKLATRRTWLAAAALAVLAAAGTTIYLNSRVTVPYFSWAKAQGWNVQPVHVVRLEPKWLMRLERVPDGLSAQDYTILRACWPGQGGQPAYFGWTANLQHFYQKRVAQCPGSFFPKHRLAQCYEDHNNLPMYRFWEQQALRQAPAILAGRIEYDDDTPVANATLIIQVQTYDAAHLQRSRSIAYDWKVTTDDEGCYYLPVFRGVYSMSGGPGLRGGAITDATGNALNIFVTGGETSDESQNWPSGKLTLGMIAASRVGVLPKMIARRSIQIISPPVPHVNDAQHPIVVVGNVLDLKWRPVAGAIRYTAQLELAGPSSELFLQPDVPPFHDGTTMNEIKLPLKGTDIYGGKAPVFNRNTAYRITIYAHNSQNISSINDLINVSDGIIFRPTGAAAPEAITEQNFLLALGPGGSVTSFTTRGNRVIVQGFVPLGRINPIVMSEKFQPLFGQENDHGAGGDFDPGSVDDKGKQAFTITLTKTPLNP